MEGADEFINVLADVDGKVGSRRWGRAVGGVGGRDSGCEGGGDGRQEEQDQNHNADLASAMAGIIAGRWCLV